MNLRQIISLSALMVLLATENSCTRKNPGPQLNTPTSGEVLLFADESLSPVVTPLLQVFNGIYSYAMVRCEYHPETDVLNALLKSRIPMVFATRQLKPAEKDYFISKKLLVREYLFAMDAISLIVHPSTTDSLVSVGQVRDILTGKTRTWAQLGFKSTTDSIQVVFDNIGSGTVRYMLDTICQGQPFGSGMSALKSNQEVIDYVSHNPGSLGIIGVAWISSSRDPASMNHLGKLKVLRISRTTPAVAENSFPPYQAFIKDNSYPLSRRLYMVNLEPRNGLATGFASFVYSDRGQRIILKTGIMPLHEPIRNVKITD